MLTLYFLLIATNENPKVSIAAYQNSMSQQGSYWKKQENDAIADMELHGENEERIKRWRTAYENKERIQAALFWIDLLQQNIWRISIKNTCESANENIINYPEHKNHVLELLIASFDRFDGLRHFERLQQLADYVICKDANFTNQVTMALFQRLKGLRVICIAYDSDVLVKFAKYITNKNGTLQNGVTTALLHLLLNSLPPKITISISRHLSGVNCILKHIIDLKQSIAQDKVKQIWETFKQPLLNNSTNFPTRRDVLHQQLSEIAQKICLLDPNLKEEIMRDIKEIYPDSGDSNSNLTTFLVNVKPDGEPLSSTASETK